jgi:hypothetical protein
VTACNAPPLPPWPGPAILLNIVKLWFCFLHRLPP